MAVERMNYSLSSAARERIYEEVKAEKYKKWCEDKVQGDPVLLSPHKDTLESKK